MLLGKKVEGHLLERVDVYYKQYSTLIIENEIGFSSVYFFCEEDINCQLQIPVSAVINTTTKTT